LVHEDT